MTPLAKIIKSSCAESCNQGRSCAELGVCQARTPPCKGCDTFHYMPMGQAYPFAPGVIDTGVSTADQEQLPTLYQTLKDWVFAAAIVATLAFLGGLGAGWAQ